MKLLISLIFLFTSYITFAQENIAVILLVQQDNKVPISDADIYLENTIINRDKHQGKTDVSGSWKSLISTDNAYQLLIIHPQYAVLDTIVTFKELNNTFVLTPSNVLDEVIVKSTEKLVSFKRGKFVINPKNEAIKGLPNVWEALKNSPIVVSEESGILQLGSKPATVIINNKVVALAGEELKDHLESIGVDDIKNLKFNIHPNASYDASIRSIIEINLNKSKTNKEQVSIRSNNGVRTNGFSKNSLGYKIALPKIRIDSRLNFNATNPFNTSSITQGGEQLISEIDGDQQSWVGYFNTDIDLSKKSWFDVTASYNNTEKASESQTTGSERFVFSNTKTHLRRFTGNALYLYTLNDSTKIDVRANYGSAESTVENRVSFSNDGLEFFQELPTVIPIFSIETNFIKERESGGYSYGIKYSNVNVDSDIDGFGVSSEISSASDFNYKENVFASYLNKEFIWKNYYISLGLRAEYTDITTDFTSTILDTNARFIDSFNYLNIIPNASFTYFTENQKTYTIGLSSGVSRPSYNLLNPFSRFESDLVQFEGDSELKPQQLYSLDLAYSGKESNLVLQGTFVNDYISTFISEDDGQLTSRYSNFSDVFVLGAQYSLQKKLASYLTSNLSLGTIYPLVSDDRFDIQGSNAQFDVGLSNVILIKKRLRLNLGLEYSSSFKDGFFEHRSEFSTFTNMSYRFKKPNLYLGLYTNDIFKTNFTGSRVLLPGVSYLTEEYNDSFIIGLNASLKLGRDIKVKKKAEKEVFEQFERVD